MTAQASFLSACAPDHPEVKTMLSVLDQMLPPAAGDPVNLLRRVQIAVMLLLAGRLESRLLVALDQDPQALPSAALIRQAVQARREAMALLETLLTPETAAQPQVPSSYPSHGTIPDTAPDGPDPSSADGKQNTLETLPPASEPAPVTAPNTNPDVASAGRPALPTPERCTAISDHADNNRHPEPPLTGRIPTTSGLPAGVSPVTAGAACSSEKPAAPHRVSSPHTPQQDKNTNLATRPSPSPSAGTTVPDRAKNSPPDHRDTTHLPLRNGHTRR